MSELLSIVLNSVQQAKAAWCRYITGNDAGTTGSHQAGFYVPKCASSLLFEVPGKKGENLEKDVTIKWQDDFVTHSKMKYYGQGSRNEYRITRFGKAFPFLQDENVGDLLVIAKYTEEDYAGFVLSSDEDIDGFLSYFNLSPTQTNHLIDLSSNVDANDTLIRLLNNFIAKFSDFPETRQMSKGAMDCYNDAYRISKGNLHTRPDEILMNWIETEFNLFKLFEGKIYSELLVKPFSSVDEFVKKANEVLNRRKSRAGKSLEHHLANIFTANNLIFEEQVVTEDNKKPDFVFPNGKCYHNLLFPTEDLIVLGVKTSCKDRWRQILNEANRVEDKYLFTLQQGISRNQLNEMQDSKVHLVVPRQFVSTFPKEHQKNIKTLLDFILFVKETQSHTPKHFLVG